MRPATVALLVLSVSLPAAAMEVSTRHDPQVDWSQVRTYAWRLMEREEGHPLAEGSPADRAIRGTVDELLAAAGMELLEEGEPDVWATYDGVVEEKYELEGLHREVGPVTWVGATGGLTGEQVAEGTLVVALVDGRTDEVLWSGLVVDIARDPTAAKIRKKAKRAVRRMLRHFPPD